MAWVLIVLIDSSQLVKKPSGAGSIANRSNHLQSLDSLEAGRGFDHHINKEPPEVGTVRVEEVEEADG